MLLSVLPALASGPAADMLWARHADLAVRAPAQRAGAGGAPPISVTSSDSEGGRTPLLTLDRLRVRKILLALLALAPGAGK